MGVLEFQKVLQDLPAVRMIFIKQLGMELHAKERQRDVLDRLNL
jgi:hypothetical protein